MASPVAIERGIRVVLDGLSAGIPTSNYIRNISRLFRRIARRLTKALGVTDPHFFGETASTIVFAARRRLVDARRGLTMLYLPDADRAGHEHGWMSDEYLAAALRLDHALGLISASGELNDDPARL